MQHKNWLEPFLRLRCTFYQILLEKFLCQNYQ
nr:MAG TPA: hypothetical protein [Caudoviricetes sp.]